MREKQKIIILKAHANGGQITKREAVDLLQGFYYCNAEKYVGETLSRMVKGRIMVRLKKGLYQLADVALLNIPVVEDKSQLKLF